MPTNRANAAEVAAMPYVLDAAEVARVLGVTPTHVRALARQGRLPGRKVGSRWRFSAARILELIEGAAEEI